MNLPDRMTFTQVEAAIDFQARLLGHVKERFEAVQVDKTVTREQFMVACTRGLDGSPGGDRPPDELIRVQKQALIDAEKAKVVAAELAAAKAKAAANAETAAKSKAKKSSKYDMSKFKIKEYNPEEIRKRREAQEKREKKKQAILNMDASKVENKKQRDKILRVQAREQEKLEDEKARKGITNLKDQRSRMTIEDKEATRTKIAVVSYDEEVAKNAQDTTLVETCSCLQGEACVDKDNCLDWNNRHAVAKAYGMGFGKSKTGVHFSSGPQSTETLKVNGKLLGR